MGGGYQGAGFKTVIPSTASAKVSFRLVFDQDPHAARAAFRDFVRNRVSADCKVEFTEHGAGRAIAMRSPRSGGVQPSSSAVADQIPVTPELKQKLRMNVVLAGFALEDDRINSPNEKYELERFRHGVRSWARVLHALGQR